MKIVTIIISFLFCLTASPLWATEEITPYKFLDYKNGLPQYSIPASSRFSVMRHQKNAPDIIFYLSTPKQEKFPIVILCGGSESKESIASIIHHHRYFLKEFLDLGAGIITLEQWGGLMVISLM